MPKVLLDIHVIQFLVSWSLPMIHWFKISVTTTGEPSYGDPSTDGPRTTTLGDCLLVTNFFKMSGVVWTAVEFNALNKDIKGTPGIRDPWTIVLPEVTYLADRPIFSCSWSGQLWAVLVSSPQVRPVLPMPRPENPVNPFYLIYTK